MTLTPITASGSTNGRPISVGTSSTTLHTCTNTAGQFDEVWLWATNTSTASITITLTYGTETCLIDIPPRIGWVQVNVGFRFNGGIVISALGSATGVNIKTDVTRFAP